MKLFKRTAKDKHTGEAVVISDMWWYRFESKGKIYTASTRLSNHKEAMKVALAERNKIVMQEAGLAPKASAPVPTVLEFTDQFLNYLCPRVAKRTYGFYVDAWQHILAFDPLANARLDAVTAAMVEKFVQARLSEPKPPVPATINHSLRTLRRCLHVAEELQIISKPAKIRLLKGERSREYVISEETLQQMIKLCESKPAEDWKAPREALDPIMGPLLLVFYDTGLRASEGCKLEWWNVSLEGRGHIQIIAGKSKNARRFIPLTDRAKIALSDLKYRARPDCPYVFTREGKPLTRTYISHCFTWARRKLGLPGDCVLHSTRHSYLTRLGEAGADAFTIMKLAGHATIQQSQKYVHPSEHRLESTVALLDSRRVKSVSATGTTK